MKRVWVFLICLSLTFTISKLATAQRDSTFLMDKPVSQSELEEAREEARYEMEQMRLEEDTRRMKREKKLRELESRIEELESSNSLRGSRRDD